MAKTVPRRWVDNYTEVLEVLSVKAQRELLAAIVRIDLADVSAARDAILAVMQPLCAAYANSAASTSARFYEICRNHCLGGEYQAYTEPNRNPDATEGAVRAFMQVIVDGKPAEQLYQLLADRMDYEIKRAAAECTYYNGENDPY